MVELVEVRIIGLPLREHQEAAEHIDDLLREFSYLDADHTSIPARLLQLRDELDARFSSFTSGPHQDLVDAIERGDETIDLAYQIPADAGPVAQLAIDLLDEADAFCRSGTHLLTLAAPPAAVRYRTWYFREFVRQCAGAAATPWAAVAE
jgi:hypothetical protein